MLVLALAAAMLLLTAGCARQRPPADTLVVGQVAAPRSLDPQVTTALNDFRILVNLYEGLVRYRPGSLTLMPGLAASWTVSEDGLVYRFKLREGVRFHDGSRFDAAAVRFNFQRMLDPEHPFHHTGPFPLAFFFQQVERVVAEDPLTVRFELSEPFAPFLSNLAYPSALLVSPAAVRRWGDEYGRHPSGTGPFRFAGWQRGGQVRLRRFEAWHGGEVPLSTLIFRPLTDPMTRVAELMAGGVDLALELSPDNVAAFRARAGYQVLEATGPHLWFLILNTRDGPLRDVRVRRALSHAIDRRALVQDVLRGTAEVADGPVPRAFHWAFDPHVPSYAYDPARARALLTEAGYGDELTLNFVVPQGGSGMLAPLAMATAVQGDLARVGVEVRIQSYEWNAYLARVNDGLDGETDLAAMAWMTNDPDTLPSLALRCGAVPSAGGFNSGWYCNPAADQLIEQARTATDRKARARLYRALAQVVQRDAPWVTIASWRQNLVLRDDVRGIGLEPSFALRLQRASKR
ncbi:ABC transporter substrate-binding protein [uncultured Thiohalocapsa sp.]|uniref:ABC transporter substrate-binding protein n=1 Tax=uncultured Thiohalocapsa sp. TaxID=768990 RepID=UPI0025D4180C|nr:ABC transporter substrate-binding protein [uncultured Thiohalocapsa sp.]